MWFGVLILLLLVLIVWRRYHHNYAMLKFKYTIYSLRDQLRLMAINSELEKESWVFDFFDTSFSKAVSSSYYITLMRLSILSVVHEKDVALMAFSKKLEEEFAKNPKLQKLQQDYIDAVKSYVIDQHYISINFIVRPIVVLIFGTALAASKLNQWLKGILVYPETSASDHFAYSFAKK